MLSSVRTCNISLKSLQVGVLKTPGVFASQIEDANKNGLAEWHITLFGKEVMLSQASG